MIQDRNSANHIPNDFYAGDTEENENYFDDQHWYRVRGTLGDEELEVNPEDDCVAITIMDKQAGTALDVFLDHSDAMIVAEILKDAAYKALDEVKEREGK